MDRRPYYTATDALFKRRLVEKSEKKAKTRRPQPFPARPRGERRTRSRPNSKPGGKLATAQRAPSHPFSFAILRRLVIINVFPCSAWVSEVDRDRYPVARTSRRSSPAADPVQRSVGVGLGHARRDRRGNLRRLGRSRLRFSRLAADRHHPCLRCRGDQSAHRRNPASLARKPMGRLGETARRHRRQPRRNPLRRRSRLFPKPGFSFGKPSFRFRSRCQSPHARPRRNRHPARHHPRRTGAG